MHKPTFNFKGLKKITNLKFPQIGLYRQKKISFAKSNTLKEKWQKSILNAPIVVLFFALIASGVTLAVTNHYSKLNTSIAYKNDNLKQEVNVNPKEDVKEVSNPKIQEEVPKISTNQKNNIEDKSLKNNNIDKENTISKTKQNNEISNIPNINTKELVMPVQGEITKDYGFQLSEYGDYRLNSKIQFTVNKETEVKAVASGIIREIVSNKGNKVVVIEHGKDYNSLYENINCNIKEGIQVQAAQVIGKVNNNLIYQLKYKGKPIKPEFTIK